VVGLLIAACSCLVLIGLGTWQLQRKAWKEGLIAALGSRAADRLAGHRNSTGSAANTAASPSAPRSRMPRKPWCSLSPSAARQNH
jgi:hypothetical protein